MAESFSSEVLIDGKVRWAKLTERDGQRSLQIFKSQSAAAAAPLIALDGAALAHVTSSLDIRNNTFLIGVGKLSLSVATVGVACFWLAHLDSAHHRALSAEHVNAAIITRFYAAFKARDWQTMQNTYADDATFSDPVFPSLNAEQVRGMWKMFCTKSADLSVEFSAIYANDRFATAHWDATYTFSKTGRKVLNRIDATFELRDGKIVAHVDDFSFHRWSSQALGGVGRVAGWTKTLNNAVGSAAQGTLKAFMDADGKEGTAAAVAAAASAAPPLPALPAETPAFVVVYTEHFAQSADRVWALAGSWHKLEWVGVIKSVEGDDKPVVGAVRTLRFVGTPSEWRFSDKLLAFDDAARSQTFASISSPLPLTNHRAVISVREDSGGDDDDAEGCTFEWVVTFSIADDAPEGASDSVVNSMRRLQAHAGAGLRRSLNKSANKK